MHQSYVSIIPPGKWCVKTKCFARNLQFTSSWQYPSFLLGTYVKRTSFLPSHNSKYIKTARIIFWRPLATKRFLRFFLSFVTTKQFYAGITTALICVGLSVFFCTMHNFIGISFALFCAYITIYPLISRKRPGNTYRIWLSPGWGLLWRSLLRLRYSGRAAARLKGFHHLTLIFSCSSYFSPDFFICTQYRLPYYTVFFWFVQGTLWLWHSQHTLYLT